MKTSLCGYTLACAVLLAGCASDPINKSGLETTVPLKRSLAYLDLVQRYGDLRAETERRLAKGDEPTTTLLAFNCISYSRLRQYSKLFECLDRLERRIASGDTRFDANVNVIFVWSASARPLPGMLRSEALMEFGDYRGAIEAGTKALELVLDDDPPMSSNLWKPAKFRYGILNVLILCATQIGDKKAADKYLHQLEAVEIPTMGRGVWANLRDNALAKGYMTVGQYDKALAKMSGGLTGSLTANLVAGMAGYQAGDNPLLMTELPRLLMYAKALAVTGKKDKAKAALDRLLAVPQVKDSGELYWLALFERGRIAEAEGDLARASGLYRRGVEIVEAQRASIATEAGKVGFVGDKQQLYARLVATLMAENKTAEAFAYVERSKARALVDMLAGKKDFGVASGDAKRVQDLLAAADSAETSSRAVATDAGRAQTRNLVAEARTQLATQAPELMSLVTVSTLGAAGVQTALASDETLVEYFYSGEDLYAFVLTRQNVFGIRLGGGKLDDDVQAFRKAIEEPGSERWREPSMRLYVRLIAPVKERLRSRNVLVVAHGALHYLPFNALHDGNQFLVESYSIRLLPAATLLKFQGPNKTNKPGAVLAFGNPDLGDPKYDLAFAQTEAETVAKAMPKSRALVRKSATKSAFRKFSSDFRVLHVASHGLFDPAKPLASALLLAPEGTDDGRLTVSELYSMRVDTDLVTLSACETGLGKIANGDDVVGLTRGFLYAGANTVVASLWGVDDEATGKLMASFYRLLAEGTGKREALRSAQVEFLRTQPHPLFWAAFQLTGNP